MKTEHKYAQVLRWIADGESVEWRFDNSEWEPLMNANITTHTLGLFLKDQWDGGYEFRLKPRTVTVNGREIAAGAKKPPRSKTTCYLPQLYLDGLVSSFTWSGSISNISAMKKGLVHLDRENAIAHAKAMLGID